MARRIAVEIVGDSSSLERAFDRSSRSASKFNSDISKMGRGAAAGSGLFRGLGRQVAFASGEFLTFATVTAFLRKSVDAAREAQVAQRSLAAQMKASGESFEQNRDRIEKVSRSYGKFGRQNDEVVAALTVLDRGTGNINKSIGLLGVTADLAGAKHMKNLGDAATVVSKVFGGQETALRRAVPGLSKNAHGWDLIREAQKKLAGQAAANATASDKLGSSIHNTEEIVGTAMLPTLDMLSDKLAALMDNTQNQEALQRAANDAASIGATTFGLLADAVGLAADAYGKLDAAYRKLPGAGQSGGLLKALWGATPGGQITNAAKSILDLSGVGGGGKTKAGDSMFQGIADAVTAAVAQIQAAVAAAGRQATAPARSLRGQFNIAELRLAQAQLTATLADDRRILVVEKAIVEQQIAQSKNLKDKTAKTQQLAGISAQILSIDQQSAAALKEQNQALRDRADAIKSAVIDKLQQKQTDVENKRALRDALDQLRIARLGGGPVGIRLATQAVNDIKSQQQLAGVERLPARLTRGGQFTLGNQITINIHGITDPDKVAKAVVASIRRHDRHTSTSSRPH